jgi:Membrane protease subunits, stomatin/prohibitin homologs
MKFHGLSCCLQTCCCPLTMGISCLSSLFVLPVQTEAVVLRFGRYERTIAEPGASQGQQQQRCITAGKSRSAAAGLHYSNIFGRQLKQISTKLQSMDLPASGGVRRTVMDKEGNPLVVSAVVTYQFVDSFKAALQIESPKYFLMTQV